MKTIEAKEREIGDLKKELDNVNKQKKENLQRLKDLEVIHNYTTLKDFIGQL